MELILDKMIKDAVKQRVTDIHISKKTIIFRKAKQKVGDFKTSQITQLYEYILYLSRCESIHSFKPQSGTFDYVVDDLVYPIRVAVVETRFTKSCVCRIHYQSLIEEVTLLKEVEKMVALDEGLILLCGPTGSGKTTHLYQIIESLSDKMVYTIENPIEIHLESCMQLEINEGVNLDMNILVTQLLRHDPDVIVLGEIRTHSEVRECLRASFSGHLIIATLHAASLDDVWFRLQDLGVEMAELKSILKGVVFHKISKETQSEQYQKILVCEKDIHTHIENYTNTWKKSILKK